MFAPPRFLLRPFAIQRTIHSSSRAHRVPLPPPISRPAPPQLPRAEQEEFEALVRAVEAGQSGSQSFADVKEALKAASSAANVASGTQQSTQVPPQQQQHPDLRKQAPPQFEGDVNPLTGEVGGPKRDPFVAGEGDWQYSGRVTCGALQSLLAVADTSVCRC
ncbi:hypothetical protein QFC19_003564 [Naganishia cerealis]|uniref:Uncharacterized protein n=1 Tax=Naganishia cerealis TaxID=610337 RepID=A0ACC2W3A8_9TREE|nr:hypothetical protein QFC19_003564 [Naganishia cerealis]